MRPLHGVLLDADAAAVLPAGLSRGVRLEHDRRLAILALHPSPTKARISGQAAVSGKRLSGRYSGWR